MLVNWQVYIVWLKVNQRIRCIKYRFYTERSLVFQFIRGHETLKLSAVDERLNFFIAYF